ncbi:MAG TPA: hypothetical protein VFL57_19070, partial [Bryobacteraceae bacterium]|nr:hypothetical protein [Bryobacteraceae bacterium]
MDRPRPADACVELAAGLHAAVAPGIQIGDHLERSGATGFVSNILDVRTFRRRTLPAPVYAISPDARWAVSPDFRRLHDLRPGYGYAGILDPNRDVLRPDNAGIWKTDLYSGRTELILSISHVSALPGG